MSKEMNVLYSKPQMKISESHAKSLLALWPQTEMWGIFTYWLEL